jgi:hypothetical protein
MRLFLCNSEGRVEVLIRAESDDGEILGDARTEVMPGGSLFGIPFDELVDLANSPGYADLPDDAEA